MIDLGEVRVAAVVVTYFPDYNVLLNLLRTLSFQVSSLILVDNGGALEAVVQMRLEGCTIEYVSLGQNMGLGYALNAGFNCVSDKGYRYIATFDQDSAPSIDLISSLVKVHEKLRADGVNCAAVGPVFFDRREDHKRYFPFYIEENGRISVASIDEDRSGIIETDSLITSGMLVRSDVWSGGNHYEDGLFVDYTDPDWCFRVRSKGYKLFGCQNIEMGHAPSDAPPVRIFGLSFFIYSPLRRYYYFRNTIKFCTKNYVSWAWRRRLLAGLLIRFFVNIIIDKQKFASFKMMIKGIRDGFSGKSGQFIH